MSITRFNKGKKFDVDLAGKNTMKLSEIIEGDKYPVDAIMFTEKGKYGKSAFIVSGDSIIYLPKHKVRDCEEIVSDDVLVEDIKAGRVGFIPVTYEDETGATRYSIDWCDM